MKRKNGEGSWGTKTIKGTVYQYYWQDNNYTYGRTIKEITRLRHDHRLSRWYE